MQCAGERKSEREIKLIKRSECEEESMLPNVFDAIYFHSHYVFIKCAMKFLYNYLT